jgi:transcription initiation factor TFIIIB Brf1 subunit/transcription initiation factor TFIIB
VTWSPPLIVQPTFGHPYCDRCGAVIVEEAKQRHVEWHQSVETDSGRVADLLAGLKEQRDVVQRAVGER